MTAAEEARVGVDPSHDAPPWQGSDSARGPIVEKMSATLLATKLFLPPPGPDVVVRSRLIERLDEGPHRRLTLLSAPAGFGKTQALAEARGVKPSYTAKLLAGFAAKKPASRDGAHAPVAPPEHALREPSSERELEILRLIAQGLSNREIGQRLFRALDTVKGHSRRIYGKLEVRNRTEAVARARELGLL